MAVKVNIGHNFQLITCYFEVFTYIGNITIMQKSYTIIINMSMVILKLEIIFLVSPLEHVFLPYTQVTLLKPPVMYTIGWQRLIKQNKFCIRISTRVTFISYKSMNGLCLHSLFPYQLYYMLGTFNLPWIQMSPDQIDIGV